MIFVNIQVSKPKLKVRGCIYSNMLGKGAYCHKCLTNTSFDFISIYYLANKDQGGPGILKMKSTIPTIKKKFSLRKIKVCSINLNVWSYIYLKTIMNIWFIFENTLCVLTLLRFIF